MHKLVGCVEYGCLKDWHGLSLSHIVIITYIHCMHGQDLIATATMGKLPSGTCSIGVWGVVWDRNNA